MPDSPFRSDELEALVRDVNDWGDGPGAAPVEVDPATDAGRTPETAPARPAGVERLETATLSAVAPGSPLGRLLVLLGTAGASDLLLLAGVPPVLRIDGRLRFTEAPALDDDVVRGLFEDHLSPRSQRAMETRGAVDLALRLAQPGAGVAGRFRLNLHRQRGGLAAAVRALPTRVPTLEQLRLPPQLAELVRARQGLVLVCGPTGAGKTSTLAALVNEINRSRRRHIVTIEDPIEYEHRHERSLVEQVEVGRDAPDFATALRACLRQDPDVVLVGEMRDLETISTALTAAETGHLILSTLHTSDVSQAVHRIIDVFPAEQQGQVRQQLALSLHAIVAQQLVPRLDGRGRVPAVELLRGTYPVRHLVRKGAVEKLHHEVQTGLKEGMVSLEASLADLVRRGLVAEEEAAVRVRRPELLQTLLRV